MSHVLWNLIVHCRVNKSPPVPRLSATVCSKLFFYGEELLVPSPTPNMKDYPSSIVRHCFDSP